MKRLAIVGGVIVVALAIAVYRAKLGAEETQGHIDGLKAEAGKLGEEINVLKAEESHLTRPERIGPIAQSQLGLAPAQPGQYVAAEALSQRLGEERLALPPTPAPEAAPAPSKPAVTPAKPEAAKSKQ